MDIIFINHTRHLLIEKNIIKIIKEIQFELLKNKKVKNRNRLKAKEMTLVFLSEKKMQQLNYQYRNKNYPTDVLSFDGDFLDSLGELVFCPVILAQQARRFSNNLNTEFVYMLIHGLLHLLGYDHEKSIKQKKEMYFIQDKLFHKLTAKKINLRLFHVNNNRTK